MTIERSPLNENDSQAMKQWAWKYRTAAWFWGILILPLLAFSAWMTKHFLQDELEIIPLLVFFGLLDLLAIWLFVKCTRKVLFVQSSIKRNEKIVTRGALQSLQTRNNGTLIYTIDHQTIPVISAKQPLALIRAHYLPGARVCLHSVGISTTQQLQLGVLYEEMPPVNEQIWPISSAEKAASTNRKDSLDALKIAAVILGIMCIVSSFFFSGGGILLIIAVYLCCFLLVAGIIFFTYRAVEAYKEKLVITGVVTEQLRVRYRIGRYGGYREMNWYRIGPELVPGTMSDQDGLQPGDTVRFEYYAGKKGERRTLIRLIKT